MKLKISKQTVTLIRTVAMLLLMLAMVLFVRNKAKTEGQPLIENFFQTLGAEKQPSTP